MTKFTTLLEINRKLWQKKWENSNLDLFQICGLDDLDYEIILNYIIEKKPKSIVEYGSGESTFIISTLIKEMNLEIDFVSFESDPYWFNKIKISDLDFLNVVNLVDVSSFETEVNTKKYIATKYHHTYENIKKPDFVIIDGPDLMKFNPVADTTINLKEMYEYYKTDDIYFYIDGRRGTRSFYDELGYKHRRIDSENYC